MQACSFLIESSSKLLITRTGIKARTSLISVCIRLLTLELLALKWRKFYTFELEYLWGQLVNLYQILCVASLGMGKGFIMFWARFEQNSGVHGNRKPPLIYSGENGVSTFSRLLLIRSFLYLQVTRTCIKSRTSSNFGQIRPLTIHVIWHDFVGTYRYWAPKNESRPTDRNSRYIWIPIFRFCQKLKLVFRSPQTLALSKFTTESGNRTLLIFRNR